MLLGAILIIFGVLFLLQGLGFILYNIWNIFWPLVLIAVGLKIMTKKGKGHWCCGHEWGEKKEESPKQ